MMIGRDTDADAVSEHLRHGGIAAALEVARRRQLRSPADPTGWLLESEVRRHTGDTAAALAAAETALAMAPHSVRVCLQVARVLQQARRWDEARAAYEGARVAASGADELAAVGDELTRIDAQREALDAYEAAVRARPADPRLLFNRAALRRFVGDLAGAEADYDEVIRLNPTDGDAWLNRSELRVQTVTHNHVAALEARLRRPSATPMAVVPLHYALAKEYEDLGSYVQSWQQLVRGAAIRRQHLRYDVAVDVATADWIRAAFPDAGADLPGNPSPEPIFIVGMPRTGTTLLERMLGASPAVETCGELNDFALSVVAAAERAAGRRGLPRRELVAASARADFAALGSDYLDRTRRRTGRRARFTDKMPLNYLYCGLIRRALPASRIIHLTRHPLATCFAVFKILFNQGYPFSYDLGEIAEYYLGYRRLMDHWHAIHPGQILDVAYERLVADPAGEGRRLFEALELDWDPAFVHGAAKGGVTTTASAAQVRRPIYATSVDLWRRYADGLEPLAARLRSAGIDVD